jgi:hypothetical protein
VKITTGLRPGSKEEYMRREIRVPVVFRYGRKYETKVFRTPMDALAYAIDRTASIAADWTIEWLTREEDPDYHPDGRKKIKGDI